MADVQILRAPTSSAPSNYTLPDAAELRLKAVYAEFDGSGAAAEFLPTVAIISDSGDVIARACEQEVSVAAGGSADVSWFPRVRRRGAAVTGQACQLLGSGNGDTTLAITLTKAVPANGVLHVVFAQVSVPDGVDAGSEPTGVVDSGLHGPWRVPGAPNFSPLIGNSRQTAAGNAFSMQVGSCVRSCVTGDLGIGSTITVTFSSVAPANFHTAGLVVWQPAYFVLIRKGGLTGYSNGDSHPDTGASMTRLSWDDDYGGLTPGDQDAMMITAMGAYPATAGFQPLNGTKIGEIASGSVSIASACAPVCEGVFVDPGGTWPAGAQQALDGNYQLAQPRVCLTT